MGVLEKIWFGDVETMVEPDYGKEELRELTILLERNENIVKGMLGEKQKESLQKCIDLVEEIHQITQCGAFISGFHMGTQVAVEAMRMK